ncbi:glycosyltransferase [Candidatus Uhrbacteria bacterium]|nr:glycosyltransferase [Candidatus Uhrbacteria bacterium]
MKIAILANAFPPAQTGGASRIAAWQAGILEQAGHQVHVWHPPIPWFDKPIFLRLYYHLADLLPRQDLVREIRAWQPEVLITHNLTGCGFATARMIQRRGVRWIHVLHDVQLFEPSGRMTDQASNAWRKAWGFLRRLSLGKPNTVLSPTKWLLDQHRQYGFFQDVETAVLPNPAPPVVFAMRMPSPKPKLFMVGATREKGIELALELLERVPDIELDVVGEGMTEGRVRFLGRLDTVQIMEKMRESDVLLVPSQIAENQPTVILEASSVGLPVIASDVGGIKETLNGAGVLCPADDIESWVRAVAALRDPSVYADQASKMYELARLHDPKEYADHFIKNL